MDYGGEGQANAKNENLALQKVTLKKCEEQINTSQDPILGKKILAYKMCPKTHSPPSLKTEFETSLCDVQNHAHYRGQAFRKRLFVVFWPF